MADTASGWEVARPFPIIALIVANFLETVEGFVELGVMDDLGGSFLKMSNNNLIHVIRGY